MDRDIKIPKALGLKLLECAKEVIDDFTNNYIEFVKDFGEVVITYDEIDYVFTKNGFMIIDNPIENTINEVDDYHRSVCARLVPQFREEYDKRKDGK